MKINTTALLRAPETYSRTNAILLNPTLRTTLLTNWSKSSTLANKPIWWIKSLSLTMDRNSCPSITHIGLFTSKQASLVD